MTAPKFFILVLLVIAVGLAQSAGFLNILNVKPNALLALLIAASFFVENAGLYLFLVLLADAFLKSHTVLEPELLIFSGLAVAGYWLGRHLRWWPVLNNLILVAASTVLFYLIAGPGFILASWNIVLGEVIYNMVLGAILFKIFNECLKTNSMLKT